jgi:hypothetical protein
VHGVCGVDAGECNAGAGGGDVVDPRRVAAPAWKPRWCLMRRPCGADDQDGVDGPYSMASGTGSALTGPLP